MNTTIISVQSAHYTLAGHILAYDVKLSMKFYYTPSQTQLNAALID